jgi:hypothetical protein
VTVWNCGVYGYSILNTLLSYEHRVRPLRPDAVLYNIYLGNDLLELASTRERTMVALTRRGDRIHLESNGAPKGRSRMRQVMEGMPGWLRRTFVNHSQLWGLARRVARIRSGPGTDWPADRVTSELLQEHRRTVGMLRRLVADDGLPLYVVVLPPHPQVLGERWWRDEIGDQVVTALQADGLHVLDLRASLPPEQFFPGDRHINAHGARTVADAVARWLPPLEKNLTATPSPPGAP